MRSGGGSRHTFSSLLTLALQCCQCFWWPSHHDFTSELIPAIGHVWHLVCSRRRRLHSGNTRFITSLFPFSPLLNFIGAFVTFLAASDRCRLIEILQQLPTLFTVSRGWTQTSWCMMSSHQVCGSFRRFQKWRPAREVTARPEVSVAALASDLSEQRTTLEKTFSVVSPRTDWSERSSAVDLIGWS